MFTVYASRAARAAAIVVLFTCLLLAPAAARAQTTGAEPPGPPAELGVVVRNANLRAGPSTRYTVVGTAPAGTPVRIAGTNKAGDWYHLSNGRWIAAFLVDRNGGEADPAPATAGNQFVVVERRLWDVYENGGTLDGPSVHCGEGRELHVDVLDANGSRLNGVAVQVQYGARETVVTGAQGKGDGVAEFVLGGGQDVKVVRDTDGSPATSDVATGLSTNAANIAAADLIAGGYCQDEASCRRFGETNGCLGHFSWNVTFQRR